MKKKLSFKKVLSVIIFCVLAVILTQLNVFAVDTLQITTEGIPEEITVVKGQSVKLSGSISCNSAIDDLDI